MVVKRRYRPLEELAPASPGPRTSEHSIGNVRPKIVRYRIRRAEEILGKDLSSLTDRTALNMAAFVWTRCQHH